MGKQTTFGDGAKLRAAPPANGELVAESKMRKPPPPNRKAMFKFQRPPSPPPQLLDLVETFLSDHSFSTAAREFKEQRERNGWQSPPEPAENTAAASHHTLVSVFQTWETSLKDNDGAPRLQNAIRKVKKISSSSSDSDSDTDSLLDSDLDSLPEVGAGDGDVDMVDAKADASSSSDSSDSSASLSSSEDESEAEAKPKAKLSASVVANPRKRKALSSSSSSSSSASSSSFESSSSSSSEDEPPRLKKLKSAPKPAADSLVLSSTSRPSPSTTTSSSESTSESESGSESGSEAEDDKAAKVPLPDLSSDDSSSSESASQEDEKPATTKGAVKQEDRNGSDTSHTMGQTSPAFLPVQAFAPLPPDPQAKLNNRGKGFRPSEKKHNEPFSRIRKDIRVDPRLSDNTFNNHNWGQKAHEDLIVTKGKGFTKEKNKKKKGAYRGGFIDQNARNGIKFE